ncbi:MAG: hypothetical protein AB8B69_12915 [Chitinophagales bacterium]
MEKPSVQKTFPLSTKHTKTLKIKTAYSEAIRYVRQTGGEIFAVYQVHLTPKPIDSEENNIRLTVVAETIWAMNTVEKGISRALTQFITECEEKEIGIEGFDVLIENRLFHEIDSRPLGYYFTMHKVLKVQFGL